MKFVIMVLLAAGAASAEVPGIRPRADLSDYRAHSQQDGITIAADVMDAEQARHAFATDVHNGYIVVEVAVYPESGRQPMDLSAMDFTLRLKGYPSPIRPVSARTIAAVLQRKSSPKTNPSDIALYPTVGIGYESGGYDPVYGDRRRGGWRTAAGVGVGAGASGNGVPAPASTDRDRKTMQTELEDKALPEGPASKAVAGYLYFPIPAKKKQFDVTALEYRSNEAKVHLNFPQSAKHK